MTAVVRLVAVLLAGLAAAAPGARAETAIGDGHVDIGPRFLEPGWTVQVRDDNGEQPVWRDLDDVVLHVRRGARIEVPRDPRFAFLGQPGAEVWLLPQVQQGGVLWPGWNTQDPEVARRVRRKMTWRLHGVEGPGRFVLFETEEFGAPRVLFDSKRPMPQQTSVEADTHVHGNWAFTRPGTYRLEIEMGAHTHDGSQVSDRAELRFFVGSGNPVAAFRRAGDAGGSEPVIPAAAAGLVVLAGGLAIRSFARRRRARTGDGAADA